MNYLKDFALNNIKNLKIGFLNVNSLRYKLNELKNILMFKYLDIFVIAATKLDETFADVPVEKYKLIRKDRDSKAGGICVYVRHDIAHQILPDGLRSFKSDSEC